MSRRDSPLRQLLMPAAAAGAPELTLAYSTSRLCAEPYQKLQTLACLFAIYKDRESKMESEFIILYYPLMPREREKKTAQGNQARV